MRADGTTEPDQRPPLEIRNGPENAIKPESDTKGSGDEVSVIEHSPEAESPGATAKR